MMYLKENTENIQAALAKYCRNGDPGELTEVRPDRVTHYRRLVFNIVVDSLTSAYPLTKQLLTEDEWNELTTDFFANHKCQSTQVWMMPGELIDYVVASSNELCFKYPFFTELLNFEWKEIEVYMQEDIEAEFKVYGDILKDNLVLNPENRLLNLTYPVHLKNAKELIEQDQGNYFLSMHRHPKSGKVLFTNLSSAIFKAIELLSVKSLNINELSTKIVKEFDIDNSMIVKEKLMKFFIDAVNNKLILGYQK